MRSFRFFSRLSATKLFIWGKGLTVKLKSHDWFTENVWKHYMLHWERLLAWFSHFSPFYLKITNVFLAWISRKQDFPVYKYPYIRRLLLRLWFVSIIKYCFDVDYWYINTPTLLTFVCLAYRGQSAWLSYCDLIICCMLFSA